MEDLQQFIENKQLPSELSARLTAHFEFQYQKIVSNRSIAAVQLPRQEPVRSQLAFA
jgi:hypothetical protein